MKKTMLIATVVGCVMAAQADNKTQSETTTRDQSGSTQVEASGAEKTTGAAASAQAGEVAANAYLGPKFAELPAAVQKTVKEQAQGQTIDDIDRETWNGKQVYEIEFEQEGGNREIHIADDGSLVMVNEAAGAESDRTKTKEHDLKAPAAP